jgi:hypothetical protein
MKQGYYPVPLANGKTIRRPLSAERWTALVSSRDFSLWQPSVSGSDAGDSGHQQQYPPHGSYSPQHWAI